MWREFNLINSFTLETTFCGPTDGRYQDCHFTISILKDCGRLFCRTLLVLSHLRWTIIRLISLLIIDQRFIVAALFVFHEEISLHEGIDI